jgi:hypothetical protein
VSTSPAPPSPLSQPVQLSHQSNAPTRRTARDSDLPPPAERIRLLRCHSSASSTDDFGDCTSLPLSLLCRCHAKGEKPWRQHGPKGQSSAQRPSLGAAETNGVERIEATDRPSLLPLPEPPLAPLCLCPPVGFCPLSRGPLRWIRHESLQNTQSDWRWNVWECAQGSDTILDPHCPARLYLPPSTVPLPADRRCPFLVPLCRCPIDVQPSVKRAKSSVNNDT